MFPQRLGCLEKSALQKKKKEKKKKEKKTDSAFDVNGENKTVLSVQ